MIRNNITVFNKIEMTEKLSDRGIFVDLATLESFLRKWSIEAIFENEKGEELYDKSAFETLYTNIRNKNQPQKTQEEQDKQAGQKEQPTEPKPKKAEKGAGDGLNAIKWQAWQDVSGDLCKTKPKKAPQDKPEIIIPTTAPTATEAVETPALTTPAKIEPEPPKEVTTLPSAAPEISPQLQTLVSDGLRNDNVFKLDISDDTLDMIARTIAKKIVKHVNSELSPETDTKLMLIEAKNEDLQKELMQTKEENEKLQEELEQKRENLGRFKKTIFGFYRFVRDRGKNK